MPLSYTVLPHRIDSSAPHCARLMMFGGWPGASTAVGGVHWVSAGACGGEISTAEMFCANGCSAVAGTYPRPAGACLGGGDVTGAPGGRVTAICTVVVLPTNTASVPRGPCAIPDGWSVPPDSSVSVPYQGPQDPSACLARTRAEVPVKSPPVNATMENGVDWVISRTVTPPPSPTSGCWVT